MNISPPTLETLLTHLHSFLPPFPSPSHPSHTILPPSIPPLPSSSSTLPPTTDSTLTSLKSYLTTSILPYLSSSSLSPNYYGFVTGGTTPAALLADWLVSIYDQNLHVHLPHESIATAVEFAALNQLVELFNLPKSEWGVGNAHSNGGGVFTTGATASNILGLAMAREFGVAEAVRRKTGREVSVADEGLYESMSMAGVRKVRVLSTLPHSSIGKACSVVGIGRGNVVSVVREGTELEVDVEALRREVSREGVVCVLVVSAGEVNTGRFATTGVEGWRGIRRVCDEFGVWVHVDGAFGLFGRVLMRSEKGYEEIVKGVEGIELADSITGDGHKLLNVPYDGGFFFTRHKKLSEKVFGNGNAAYLTSMVGHEEDIQSPLNIGLENSRRFRALPAHATLTAYGREGHVDMLKRQVGLARRVTMWLIKHESYEVLPAQTNVEDVIGKTFMIVLFRARNEVLNKKLVKKINATGRIYVTGTVWKGQPAARIAVSNWRADVERDGSLIETILEEVAR